MRLFKYIHLKKLKGKPFLGMVHREQSTKIFYKISF